MYVLLKPPPKKKKKNQAIQMPQAPSHLSHLVVKYGAQAEVCPWQLSGPQFPQPTAIQQRYCYPRGDPEYSSRVGGALWTMYGTDGKEDDEFRLLHVYYSAKRAVNKGLAMKDDRSSASRVSSSSTGTAASPARAAAVSKRAKKFDLRSPPRRIYHRPPQFHPLPMVYHPSTPMTMAEQQQQQQQQHQQQQHQHVSSPLSFDAAMSPPSPVCFSSAAFVTPNTAQGGDPFRRSRCQALPHEASLLLTPSPFRRPASAAQQHQHNIQQSPLYRSSAFNQKHNSSDDDKKNDRDEDSISNPDPFPFDITSSFHDIDSYWNDPLMNIMLKPSQNSTEPNSGTPPPPEDLWIVNNKDDDDDDDQTGSRSFAAQLDALTQTLHQRIQAAPVVEQATMMQQLEVWATQLAQHDDSPTTLDSHHQDQDHPADTDDEFSPVEMTLEGSRSHEGDTKATAV